MSPELVKTLGVSRDPKRILGGVRIGDHAVVGANVVIRDVPPLYVAVGVPAIV